VKAYHEERYLPSFYRRLLKHFGSLSRSLTRLPDVPSEADKRILRKLEKIKVENPFDSLYRAEERKPVVCGTVPERIGVEIREYQLLLITYWYYWSYDIFLGDHENWEPVTLIYEANELVRVNARVHDALVSCTPENKEVVVHFYKIGHTPVVKVKDKNNDVMLEKLNDGLDDVRQRWLSKCYRHAEDSGWQTLSQPQLESENVPILDETYWRMWGKHSIYVRI